MSRAPRVHAQYVATSAIQPSDDDDLLAGADAPETLKHLRLEDQPRLGCALVGLPGRRLEIGQGRLDPPDGLHLETCHLPPPELTALRFASETLRSR